MDSIISLLRNQQSYSSSSRLCKKVRQYLAGKNVRHGCPRRLLPQRRHGPPHSTASIRRITLKPPLSCHSHSSRNHSLKRRIKAYLSLSLCFSSCHCSSSSSSSFRPFNFNHHRPFLPTIRQHSTICHTRSESKKVWLKYQFQSQIILTN